jgi:hypothetical protein
MAMSVISTDAQIKLADDEKSRLTQGQTII